MITRLLLAACVALAVPCAALAQATTPARPAPGRTTQHLGRVYLSLSAMMPVMSDEISESFVLRKNVEDGRLDAEYRTGKTPGFDAAGGVLLTRHFGVGVGVTSLAQTTPATVRASIPHPLLFDQPRLIEGRADPVDRALLAFHVQARVVLPLSRRVQVMLFGGPTLYKGEQQLVSDVEYSETYPFDTATFERAVLVTAEESKVGVHGGADVGYFLTRRVGLGLTAQYVGQTFRMSSGSSRSSRLTIGGVQAAGGLRLRF